MRIVLFIVLIIIIFLIFRKIAGYLGMYEDNKKDSKKNSKGVTNLVKCSKCGTYINQDDARKVGGEYICDECKL